MSVLVIDHLSTSAILRLLSLVTIAVLLAACGSRQGEDFCADHHLFHASHLDSIGTLDIKHSNDGTVRTEFSLPTSIFKATDDRPGRAIQQVEEILHEPDNMFALRPEGTCNMTSSNVTSDANLINARYLADCGSGARIKQIDVPLFDLVEQLDEVEVFVVTPATQKRFAISRRCESAIFRLQTGSDR
jgi:hypothetical protein